MIYCFDTSAINRIHDDPVREPIARGLTATCAVYVSALNIIEACGTRDPLRRGSLISLQKRLSDTRRPLATPNELLQELAIAHAHHRPDAQISITDKQEGIWITLNDPSQIDDAARQEALEWKHSLEAPFREVHEKARFDFQNLFRKHKLPRLRTASGLIRHYCSSEDLLFQVVGDLYLRTTGSTLVAARIRQFLSEVPQWKLYLLGWAHAVFSRAIREQGYGAGRHAGTIDLSCAAYLPSCDWFVTDDNAQRRALRIINTFNSRRTRIISYDEMRKRLLLG